MESYIENTNNINNSSSSETKGYLTFDLSEYSNEFKTPKLYETWNWEGDLSVLPYKWVELAKNSPLANKFKSEELKEFLKVNYYNNSSFDKKSFFFLTHRSEVAGCFYLNKIEEYQVSTYCIEFFLINHKKHQNKGVEEGLVSLAVKRVSELIEENKTEIKKLLLDLSTTNVELSKLQELGFS